MRGFGVGGSRGASAEGIARPRGSGVLSWDGGGELEAAELLPKVCEGEGEAAHPPVSSTSRGRG